MVSTITGIIRSIKMELDSLSLLFPAILCSPKAQVVERITTITVVITETRKLFLKNCTAPLVLNTSLKLSNVHTVGRSGGFVVKISPLSLNDMVKVQNNGKAKMSASAITPIR